MGTEELLIFRIENDLRKLKNKKAIVNDLQIKARLQRLENINKPMFEELEKQLNSIIAPIFSNTPQDVNKQRFNALFKQNTIQL